MVLQSFAVIAGSSTNPVAGHELRMRNSIQQHRCNYPEKTVAIIRGTKIANLRKKKKTTNTQQASAYLVGSDRRTIKLCIRIFLWTLNFDCKIPLALINHKHMYKDI